MCLCCRFALHDYDYALQDKSITSTTSLIMKLTAILLATLLEASKATVVSYTDGGGVRQDVAVSDVNKPGLAGLLYAVFSSATANLRGAESYAAYCTTRLIL